jgi:hypothetical protein
MPSGKHGNANDRLSGKDWRPEGWGRPFAAALPLPAQ